MKLSVVVPTYKRPESVRACLESILEGDAWPDEVVVVTRDTDVASQEAVAAFRARVGKRFVVKNVLIARPGQPAALNEGTKAADGDVLLFLDDDVVVHRDWLRRMKRDFEDPEVGGVGGRDVIFHDGVKDELAPARRIGEITWYGRLHGNHYRPATFGEPRQVQHIKGANMSFRREYLAEFDERFVRPPSHNDTDISLSAIERGAKLIYDPGAKVDHHPAARQFAGGRDNYHPNNVFGYAHNKTYCLLKHLPPLRRCAFVLFSVLVGQGQAFGLVKTMGACFSKGPRFALRTFIASMKGQLAAYRTYRRWRTESARQPP